MMAAKIVVVARSGSKTGQIEFYSTHCTSNFFSKRLQQNTTTHPPSPPNLLGRFGQSGVVIANLEVHQLADFWA